MNRLQHGLILLAITCSLLLTNERTNQSLVAQTQPAGSRESRIKVRPEMTDGIISEGSIIFNYVDQKRRRRLSLDVYRPKDSTGQSPAIVMYFGGGWQNGRPALFAPLAQALAQKGYVCIVPEYRLSGEAPFPAAVHDAKAAIRWTRKHAKRFKIDPNKIASLGGSAGGHLAGFIATTTGSGKFEGTGEHQEMSSAVQAAIVMCGPMDLLNPKSVERVNAAAKSRAGHAMIDFLQGETPDSNHDLYEIASPVFHAGKQTPPMLFIDGEKDTPGTRSEQLREVLNTHQIPNRLVILPRAPHPFWVYQQWFHPTVEAVDSFLTEQFGDE
ncbi:MAG: alpha/beta hydrolase [Planctomycetaceae bacterium]|nr:alpha/beta hydrolase [Planctomycetaceae bacterium]